MAYIVVRRAVPEFAQLVKNPSTTFQQLICNISIVNNSLIGSSHYAVKFLGHLRYSRLPMTGFYATLYIGTCIILYSTSYTVVCLC